MSKISAMMDTGKRSLMNSQTSLQTVAHNIANKSTEGYSRQRVDIVSNTPIGTGNIRIGMGARAAAVTRVNNPFLEKQMQKETGQMGYMSSKSDALARVEEVYNEQNNKGLNSYIGDFFNSFRELSNNPESLTSRTIVRETADVLAKDFKRVNNQLTNVQKEIDSQITSQIEEVNQYTREIAQLNGKILEVENQKIPANDERDRRDLLLKKLNEKLNISWAEGEGGMVSVTAGNSAPLVSGFDSVDLKAVRTDKDKVDIFYTAIENGELSNITQQFNSGTIGGALEVRDVIIEKYLSDVDNMAYTMAKEVNKAHIEGFDRVSRKGVLFFEMPEDVKGASANLQINKTILNDVTRISAGSKAEAPSDNTVANVISSLQYKSVFDNDTSTIDEFYNSQVGQIGVLAQRAEKTKEAQENILSQLTNIRESISGVSLDEEATKMIEFQKTFDASAKLIKTADEMFDTILSLKR